MTDDKAQDLQDSHRSSRWEVRDEEVSRRRDTPKVSLRLLMGRLKNALVVSTIIFTFGLIVYVSIPDFPRAAHPWEIMLWGESSQWWSEVSWILVFAVFSISLLFVLDWSGQVRNVKVEGYQKVVRIAFLVVFLSILWNFSALYFHWDGWAEMFILDRGGYLHGVFYLGVVLEGLWLFEELIGFVSKIVPKLSVQSA